MVEDSLGRKVIMRIFIAFILILLLPLYAFSEDKGKKLYDDWCAQCHGYKGDGKGYAADFTFPKPRDFVNGIYKFRSTPSGSPPTDNDIIRSIRTGNPGTSMPPWKRFSDDEVKSLVDYLKKFSPENFESQEKPIKIGQAPRATAELIEKGKRLFEEAKCWECHGKSGRGDGVKGWQEKFKDEWHDRIYPANYSHPWELRNGSDVEDLYRTITVGIEGTPMASYQDALKDDERWAIAHFVKSLQVKRRLGIALRMMKMNSIPSLTDHPIWGETDYLDIPMGGQILFNPRYFTPTITNVRVRGVYTNSEIAIMLEWVDKKPNKGDDGMPPDAAHMQFPQKIQEGAEKPYFYMGDKRRAVNIWQWKASEDSAKEYIAKGPEEVVTEQERQDVRATATYTDGLYRVIFKRPLNTGDSEDTVFEVGRFIPFTVTLYDGRNKEEGNKGVISAWYYLMLEPPM